MAPFLAEKTSHIVQTHPDWFLRDSSGTPYLYQICEHDLYLLDYSQDEVCSWWKETLNTVRSWGITYFKFDFLKNGIYPVPGKNAMTPLTRFHRCFDIISEVLDKDDCYILGCSAVMGPCFGRGDGIHIGPDISPNISAVRDSAFACIGHFYLEKHVLDCDTDYLVLRGEGERDPNRPEMFEDKFGRLSQDEARLWSSFSSIDAHIVLAGDNLNFIPDEKKNMIRKLMAQKPGNEIFCVDAFAGASSAAECILSDHGGKINISLFNWDEKPKKVSLSGPETGTWTIPPNGSVMLEHTGNASFEELARTLRTDRTEQNMKTYDSMIRKFPAPSNAEPLPLGNAAACPLQFERKTLKGMASGIFAPILSKKNFSGIPFDFTLSGNRVIEQSFISHNASEIAVSGKAPVLYFLYGVWIPVKNRVCTIRLHFKDSSFVEFPVDCGENIGNFDIRYLFDWKERDAHLSWGDNATFACLFTARFVNPEPEKEIEKIVVTELCQRGTLYIAGLTKADR